MDLKNKVAMGNIWGLSYYYKRLLTVFCLAEASKNIAFQSSANFLPSSVEIILSICKSVLFPTKTMGTLKNYN